MDWETYARFAAALLFVLGLIAGLSYIVRRLGFAGAIAVSRPKADRRLGVVETLPLDGKRRLVLLRCDAAEHLVILGPNQEISLGVLPGGAVQWPEHRRGNPSPETTPPTVSRDEI